MERKEQPSATTLSLTTLVVGSLSSAATAVVVHEFWRAGAIVGAAVTPVLIALFSEALRRPITRVQTRSWTLVAPRAVRIAGTTPDGVPVRVYRAAPRWRPALATGVAAFVIGATGLTASELVLDRSVADRGERTTLLDVGPRQPSEPLGTGSAAASEPDEERQDEEPKRRRTSEPRADREQDTATPRPERASPEPPASTTPPTPSTTTPSTTPEPAPPTATTPQPPPATTTPDSEAGAGQ